ncbi:MAG: hypothetical protein JSR72_07205 [Proteobacteria bacterium]|nr:hypothetical protein [Pseudomonadota bacterium]
MADHIRYDLLTQQALRGVVRNVLSDTAKKGLPGDHHFYISFQTHAEGVRLSDRLRAQYPEEMTIILQYQFWDLAVTEQGFEVGMSFGGIPEKLYVPFSAITGFFDPSVQFGLQFEEIGEDQTPAQGSAKPARGGSAEAAANGKAQSPGEQKVPSPAKTPAKPATVPVVGAAASVPSITPAGPAAPTDPDPDKPSGGGEVVRLDRFRKK